MKKLGIRLSARIVFRLGSAISCALGSNAARAHAFGERYELPLPLEFYLGAAVAAIVVSFIVIGFFVRRGVWLQDYPVLNLSVHSFGRLFSWPAFVFVVKLGSVLLLALTIAAGFIGNQDPFRNLAPVLVWILFWVGMALVSAFVGNLWAAINPWRTLFAWVEALWRRLLPGREFSIELPYPKFLGVWPSVLLLFAFAWAELISSHPASPSYIATMALGYSILTWTGMILFGRERWIERGEIFLVTFSILARFAPTEIRPAPPGSGVERVYTLRPFAAGLMRDEPASVSMVALVLLYLAAVVFDGVLAMPAWSVFETAAIAAGTGLGSMAIRTLGLIGLWLACSGLYLLACSGMAALAGGRLGVGELARRFVMTLVPIAIAYHLAHYLTYLLIHGQYIIPIASDPFGRGWNLFGTAGYRVDVGLVGARFAWYTAVVAIVTGHIVAVFLAHARAMTVFGQGRIALRSQYPLTVLMVVFTVSSLSILAEPMLQKPFTARSGLAPETVVVPMDAVLPEPGSGRLVPVGPGRAAGVKLTYSAMTSPFHDGTAMTVADLLYPYAIAYRWGAADTGASVRHDPAVARATAGLRTHLKGIKFSGVDPKSKTIRFGDLNYAREQMLVDVYLDMPANDPKAAAIAPPWSPVPWHVLALMEEAVMRGFAAFSRMEAERLGIEWLDPVRSEPLKQRLLELIERFGLEGFVPEPIVGIITPSEARSRWKALAAFYAEHKHFLVTNGPYRIQDWSDNTATLAVVRDPLYPLGVGSYDAYAIPRRAFVTGTEIVPEGIALSVEVESVETVGRNYRIVRQPLKSVVADTRKRSTFDARFVAIGADGKAALAGRGLPDKDGVIVLYLQGNLAPGRYTIITTLAVNDNTVKAEIRSIPYEVARGP